MGDLPAVGVYTVRIEEQVDADTNIKCLREEWRDHRNYIHRNNAPAVTLTSVDHGKIFRSEWWQDYELHNDAGPAIVEDDEIRISSTWYQQGQKHRENAAAYLSKDLEGRTLHEEWCYRNMLHRLDGPSLVIRDEDTFIATHESYHEMGEFHRSDGPAFVLRNPATGIVYEEEWHLKGKLHRMDGPAVIKRDYVTGEITEQHFYRNGKKVPAPQINSEDPSLTEQFQI